jgi:hypothetical protein
VTPVDKIAHKQIVGVRALASNLEELHEILELTVDVTANLSKQV